MKVSNKLRKFLVSAVCTSTSLLEGIQMVAVLEVIFALGFIAHGSYLCYQGPSNDRIFGVLYLFSGIIYWTLTWLLWMASENQTILRCRVWILSSLFNQFMIFVLMVTRSSVKHDWIWSANIWILSGMFLQFYMIIVVWAFMLDFQRNEPVAQQAQALAASSEKASDEETKTVVV